MPVSKKNPTMKQVSNETAVTELAAALENYDNACPDVGPGWHWGHFVEEAMKKLGLTRNDVDPKVLIHPRGR